MPVKCLLCNVAYGRVSYAHLRYAHGITTDEYRKMFPDANLTSVECRERMVAAGTLRLASPYERQRVTDSLIRYHRVHPMSEETRQKISDTETGKVVGEETKRRMSKGQKLLWKDPNHAERMFAAFRKKPNESELRLQYILDKYFPDEWKYTGDGTFWVEGRNPDFLNVNSEKQVIELFGVYWHNPEEEAQRVKHYKRYGLDCLVLWEHDAWDEEEVVTRIENWRPTK